MNTEPNQSAINDIQNVLKKHKQEHLIQKLNKQGIAELIKFNDTYDGGLDEYIKNGKRLMNEIINGIEKYDKGSYIAPAKTIYVDADNINCMLEYENLGIQNIDKVAFVILAGGMGERLGYNDIKLSIVPNTLNLSCNCFEHYCKQILHYQELAFHYKKLTNKPQIQLIIMTSVATYARTIDILASNNYYGLEKEQVIILKQDNAPCFTDKNGNLALENGRLVMKPHGHGDLHVLMYRNNIVNYLKRKSVKYLCIFNDTNIIITRSVLSSLGVSIKNNIKTNVITIHRKPGEKIGAMVQMTNTVKNETKIICVEYNMLADVLKLNNIITEPTLDGLNISLYPGNTNNILVSLDTYEDFLSKTRGIVKEFVNPKFTGRVNFEFKSPCRLETMYQDFLEHLPSTTSIACSMYPRWFAFSPIKNTYEEGYQLYLKNCGSDTIFSCDIDIRNANFKMLLNILKSKLVNMTYEIEEPISVSKCGIILEKHPNVYLDPAYICSYVDIVNAIKNFASKNIKITHKSCIIITSFLSVIDNYTDNY